MFNKDERHGFTCLKSRNRWSHPLTVTVLALFIFCQHPVEGGTLTRRGLTENHHPDAFCNDGTRSAYYHSTDKDHATGVIVFFQGGLHCVDVLSCLARCEVAAPQLCTSSLEPELGEGRRNGILSDDPEVNPGFHDYYKAYLPYCTSDMYSGNRSASPQTGGYQFRGRAVVTAVINSLLSSSPLAQARQVIMVGVSAGARGVAFNCQTVGAMLSPGTDFRCIVDSSIFYPNISTFTPDCLHFNDLVATGNEFWNGGLDGFDVNTWWYEFPEALFLGYMTHDTFGLFYYCLNDSDHTQLRMWGDAISELAQHLVVRAPHVGLYMPGCRSHVMVDNDFYSEVRVGVEGLEYREVIEKWARGDQRIHAWDDCTDQPSPICNSYCNGDLGSRADTAYRSGQLMVAFTATMVMVLMSRLFQ